MSNNPTIVGDNTVLWGTSGVSDYTGYVTSARKVKNSKKEEIPDINGFTIAAVLYDHKTALEFEMTISTAAPDSERGDLITICGVENCMIDEIEEMWAKDKVRMYRITATKYEGMDFGD